MHILQFPLKFYLSEYLFISAWLTAVRTFEIFGLVTSFIFAVTLALQLAATDSNLKGKAKISYYFLSALTGKLCSNFTYVQLIKKQSHILCPTI